MNARDRLRNEIRKDIKQQEFQLADFMNQAEKAQNTGDDTAWKFWSTEVVWLMEKIDHNRQILTMLEHY